MTDYLTLAGVFAGWCLAFTLLYHVARDSKWGALLVGVAVAGFYLMGRYGGWW